MKTAMQKSPSPPWALPRGIVPALFALTVLSAAAFGQVRVQLNNPLDANPQQGTGGSNEPISGYGPINGNDIITGNVSGLKYFHAPTTSVVTGPNGTPIVVQNDSLGTFSPYTFQAPQGSASFNDFARQSAGGTQSNIGQTQAYFLPSTTVSTAQGSLYSSPYGSGFDSSMQPRSATSPLTGPLSSGIAIRQFESTPTAAPPTPDQSSGALSSPLFGTRSNPLSASMDLSATPDLMNPVTGAPNVFTPANPNPAAPSQTPDDMTDTSNQTLLSGVNAANNRGNALNDLHHTARITGQTDDLANANVLPQDQTLTSESRVSDTYRTLLQRIQDAKAAEIALQAAADAKNGITPKNGTANASANGTKNNTDNTLSPANGQTAQGTDQTSTPGMGRQTLDPLTGLPRKAPPGQANPADQGMPSMNPLQTPYQPRSAIMARSQLENTPTSTLQAGRDVPPLKTLADIPRGGTPTAFASLMKNAEALLKQGKYMEAANAYQIAITTEPNDALAVIGRAHAELGAGMYESAANDLRFVFTRKPELISVRFPLGDFLPPERQNYLIKDLQTLSTNPGPGNTASFLLSYLYYNTGRPQDAQAELDRWSNRPWHDSWQGVLTRAWGGAGGAEGGGK